MAQARPKCRDAQMEIFTRVFTPSRNRRLNELVGFLLFAAAVLLFLALISYSPLDNSWNTAATTPTASPARNWIGVVGDYVRRGLSEDEAVREPLDVVRDVDPYPIGQRLFPRSTMVDGMNISNLYRRIVARQQAAASAPAPAGG